MQNLKAKIKKKIQKEQFLHACEKVKRTHKKVNACRFKILETCLRDLDEVGIPVTDKEKDLMTQMIALYDKTLQELGEDVKRFRGYVNIDECEHMDERTAMYKAEKNTIKSWLDEIGCKEPVGYWYNYGARNLVLYTNKPGQLIGKHGQNIEVLKDILIKNMAGNWTIELIEIKGGFVV